MDETIGLYLWNGEVSSCFASHLSYFEIVLRNSIHRAMSLFYTRGRSPSVHWYDLAWKALSPTTQRRIEEVRQRRSRTALDADEMVASLSFGFWPAVLRNIDHAHANLILPAIFPFHPLSAPVAQWRDTKVRRGALAFVFELHAFRNRLAHHEPLWKFGVIRGASGNTDATNLRASRTPADSIARLRRLLELIEEATGFVDRSVRDDLVASTWRRRLDFLLTDRGIQRYRSCKHVPDSSILTPAEFRYRFTLVGRNNQPVRVRQSRSSGLFIPD